MGVPPSGFELYGDGSSDSVATWLPFQPGKGWFARVGGGSARNGPTGPNRPKCLDFRCSPRHATVLVEAPRDGSIPDGVTRESRQSWRALSALVRAVYPRCRKVRDGQNTP